MEDQTREAIRILNEMGGLVIAIEGAIGTVNDNPEASKLLGELEVLIIKLDQLLSPAIKRSKDDRLSKSRNF